MKKTILMGLATAQIILVWTCLAHASIIYNFTAYSSYDDGIGNISGAFTLTLPAFITADTTFDPSQLDSGYIIGSDPDLTLGDVSFNFGNIPFNMIGFGGNNIFMYYYFDDGAFTSVGSYDTVLFDSDQAARLDVINTDTNIPVPEPTTMILIGTGMVCLACRKKNK